MGLRWMFIFIDDLYMHIHFPFADIFILYINLILFFSRFLIIACSLHVSFLRLFFFVVFLV